MAIIFQIDTSKAVSSIDDFNNMVKASNRVVGDFATKTVTLNDAGKVTVGVIEQMSASGRKLASTFEVVGGRAEFLGTKINESNKALREMGVVAEQAGQQGAAGGQAFGISWQGLLRILEVQLFRRAITGIINAVRDGITGAIDYQIQLQQVANVTNQSGPGLNEFAGRIRAISEQFAVPIGATLTAAQIALTGQLGNTAAGFNVLTSAMRLSQATGVEVGATTRLITSTMQAFRLPQEENERVANDLFLVAQRSRVPLNEMATAIGRIAQTAHGLNVTDREVEALFLTITQQGGRATEAFSLLNSVLGHFITPTQQIQEFLNSLGTPTGALAVGTFGLPGFLEQLNRVAAETPEKLSEISGSLRTFRGLAALTGDNTRIFTANLQALNSGGGALTAANARVAETSAQKIRVEFEKLKNIFVTDIGSSFVNGVVKISDALGGGKVTLIAFTEALKTLIFTFASYKISVDIILPATNLLSVAIGRNAEQTAIARSNMIGYASAFTVAFAAGSAYFGILNSIEAAERARIQRNVQGETTRGGANIEAINNLNRGRATEADQIVTRSFQQRITNAANAVRLSNEVMQVEINNHKRVAEEFRLASQEYLDGLRRRLAETKQAASQAASEILQSRRSVEQFQQQTEARGFQRRLGIEGDPRAAIDLLNQRIQTKIVEAQGIFTSPASTREDIERARSIFHEIQSLQDERAQRDIGLQRLRNEQSGNFTIEERNGQRVRVIRIDLTDIQQRENNLVAERTRLEEGLQAQLRARQAEEQRSVANQTVSLRIFESLLRQQEQFKVFDSDGKFVQQFQQAENRQRGTGGTAALAQFDELARRLREQATQQGADLGPINDLIAQRRLAIIDELAAHRGVEGSLRNQNDLIAEQNRARQRSQEISTGIGAQERGIAALAQQGAERLQGLRPSLATPTLNPDATLNNLTQDAQDAVVRFNAFRAAVDEARQAENRLNAAGGQTQTNLDSLGAALRQLETRARALGTIEPLSSIPLGLGRNFQDDVTDFLTNKLPGLQAGLEAMRSRLLRPDGGLNPLRDQMNQLNQSLQNGPGAQLAPNFNDAANAANLAGPAMQQALDNAALSASNLNARLMETLANFDSLSGIDFNAGTASSGGVAGFAATGGIAGAFPGSPRGTDVLPYWLSRGEFIINPDSSRKFYSQLVSINAGIQPGYAAHGGPVSVGDIHLHVSGGDTSEKTIREIGRGINREIKRGTIRFDGK